MIEKLRNYFITIDLLDENGKIGVDFLGNDAVEYVIEPIPSDRIYKSYTDGSYLELFQFQFSSRESYGEDVITNMLNNEFYRELSHVIESNNKRGILPLIEGIQSIEVLNQGAIQDAEVDTAKYAIQMQIKIYKEVL